MSFLNPLFLWVLPITAIPVALHLLSKRPPKKMLYSHIGWLKQVHQATMPRKKLREILLMIVRTCIVLFLIFFFARPILHRGGFLTGNVSNESMVVLLDVSASMNAVEAGRDGLDWAKDRLQEALRKIPIGVRVGLVVFSDQVEQELAPTDERSRITNAIANAPATMRGTDVLPALKLGGRMLANQPKGRKTLLVVSDLAQHGWSNALKTQGRIDGVDADVRVVLWDAVGKIPNTGVSSAGLELSEEGALKGEAQFHHIGKNPLRPTWSLKLNNRVVAQGGMEGENGPLDNVVFKAQLPEGGYYAGELALTPDAAPFDDTYYIAGRVPKGFRLLIVDGEGGLAPADSETYYLRSALDSPRDPRVESMDVVRTESLAKENFDHYDAIVLANVGPWGEGGNKESELISWVENGGGLFLTAGSKWPKPPVTPLRLFRSSRISTSKELVAAPDAKAPFLSSVSGLQDFQWDQISVTQHVVLENEASSTPLLTMKNGDAFLVRKQIGKGFVLCLTTSVDRAWTNFPAKPVFAPMMRELVAALADPLREQTALQCFIGAPVRLRVSPGVKSVSVIAPNGVASGARLTADGFMEAPAPTVPGIYRVQTDRRDGDFSFAVNIPRLDLEGDLTRLPERDAKNLFPDTALNYVGDASHKTEALIAALQGRDMTNPLLAGLFILFAGETLLGFAGRRRDD